MKSLLNLLIVLLLINTTVSAQRSYKRLRHQIDSIEQKVTAKIGFALINIETKDTFSYNGYIHQPAMSTVKFPLALMIMKMIDSGKLSLEQKIRITVEELNTPTRSTLKKDLNGAKEMSVRNLLLYMIHVSDNISCSVFTRLVGGGKNMEAYVKQQGLEGIEVTQIKGKPYIDFNRPYNTWCTPVDMAKLLKLFYKKQLLSKTSTDTLLSIMERTTGGAMRIKRLLPEGTIVAHKTGTSGTANSITGVVNPTSTAVNGITTAVNDIGIVTLPNGKHLILTLYIADISGDMEVGEAIIARIAKAAYDDAVKN